VVVFPHRQVTRLLEQYLPHVLIKCGSVDTWGATCVHKGGSADTWGGTCVFAARANITAGIAGRFDNDYYYRGYG